MKKEFVIIAFIFFGMGIFNSQAHAESRPQVLLTWKASSDAPSGFRGKIMPSPKTEVRAGLEVLDGSSLGSLIEANISWFLNGDLIQEGVGLQRISFTTPNSPGEAISLRVEISEYKGVVLAKTIQIPIVRPLAVIRKPFPGDEFSSKQLHLIAKPFFFPSSEEDYSFSWKVNGKTPSEENNPRILNVNVSGERSSDLKIELSITGSSQKATVNSLIKYRP